VSLTDFSTGAQGALQQLIARRLEAQRYAQAQQQQQFQNERQLKGDARAQQQLDSTMELTRMQREAQVANMADQAKQRTYAEANVLGDQLPPETFLQANDPAAVTMQQGGRGALLTPKDAGMGAAFQGPMATGETPESVANDRPRGFLKTASAKQQTDAQNQADKRADNERQAGRDAATEKYQAGMLSAALQNANSNSQRANASTAPPAANTNEVQDTLDLIDRITSDPALPTGVGPLDSMGFGKVRDLSGVNRFENLHNELVGKMSLAQAGKLKGQGQISDKERQLLRQAATALNRNMSEADYQKELASIKVQFQRMLAPNQVAPMPAHSGAPATTGPVKMTAPDGRSLTVPADKVAELEALGAKRN